MTQRLQDFFETYDQFDKMVDEMFEYIVENYKQHLELSRDPYVSNWNLYDNALEIEYSTRRDSEYLSFYIPKENIINNTWKDFIDKWANDKSIEKINKENEEYMKSLAKQYDEYQRLKKMFNE